MRQAYKYICTHYKHWKGLPKEVVRVSSLTIFKKHLDNTLRHVV